MVPAVQGTVYEAFLATAGRYAQNDFLCVLSQTAAKYGIPERSWSYAEAQVEIEELARIYRAAGVGLGQRVGLMLENRPAFFFHWLALNGLGASVVPINPEWRSAELEYLVGHSELGVAVVPPERVEDLRLAALNAGRKVAVTTPDLNLLDSVPLPAAVAGAAGAAMGGVAPSLGSNPEATSGACG